MELIDNKKRIEWLDITKGFCMFFIISAHSGFVPSYLDYFYNSFFLSAYFILSGYLFHNPERNPEVFKKLTKIVESLLVPYLVYWALSYTVDSLLRGNYNILPNLFWDIVSGKKLWFMSCLIVSEIVFALYISFFRKTLSIVVFIFLSFLVWYFLKDYKLPWAVGISFMANVFLAFGYLLRIHNDAFLKFLNNDRIGIGLIFAWVGLFIAQCFLEYRISFPANDFGNLFFYFPYVIVGSFAVFYLSTKWKRHTRLALFLGQNSLLYYFFQGQVLKLMKSIFVKFGFTNPDYFKPLLIALLVSLILILPILLVKRYFPIMAGKIPFLSTKFGSFSHLYKKIQITKK